MPTSFDIIFQVDSFIPSPAIGAPQFLQLKGSCSEASFTKITMGISPGDTVSPATDPHKKGISINARQDRFDQLCACLAAPPVQLTITYTLENGLVCVNDISCKSIPSQFTLLLAVKANTEHTDQDLHKMVLPELKRLSGLVAEALRKIPGAHTGDDPKHDVKHPS